MDQSIFAPILALRETASAAQRSAAPAAPRGKGAKAASEASDQLGDEAVMQLIMQALCVHGQAHAGIAKPTTAPTSRIAEILRAAAAPLPRPGDEQTPPAAAAPATPPVAKTDPPKAKPKTAKSGSKKKKARAKRVK